MTAFEITAVGTIVVGFSLGLATFAGWLDAKSVRDDPQSRIRDSISRDAAAQVGDFRRKLR